MNLLRVQILTYGRDLHLTIAHQCETQINRTWGRRSDEPLLWFEPRGTFFLGSAYVPQIVDRPTHGGLYLRGAAEGDQSQTLVHRFYDAQACNNYVRHLRKAVKAFNERGGFTGEQTFAEFYPNCEY